MEEQELQAASPSPEGCLGVSACVQGCPSVVLGWGLGWAQPCPSACPPHSLPFFLPYIQSLFFIPDAISSSAGALHWERRPRVPAPWTAALQPPGCAQCWEGAGTLRSPWAGLGVVLFCSALWKCPPCVSHCSWGWMGGCFLSGQREACQMRVRLITLFLKKTYSNVSIRIHRKLNFVFGFN